MKDQTLTTIASTREPTITMEEVKRFRDPVFGMPPMEIVLAARSTQSNPTTESNDG